MRVEIGPRELASGSVVLRNRLCVPPKYVIERRFVRLLENAGLPLPELQYEVALPNGRKAYLDAATDLRGAWVRVVDADEFVVGFDRVLLDSDLISFGGWSLAWKPHRTASALPAMAPMARTRSSAHPAPSR